MYRIKSDYSYKEILSSVDASNGKVWSSDNNMFYTQSLSGEIRKFDYDFNTGSQCDIKIEYKLKGQILDGVAIDSEDKLWVALWSEGKAVCINTKLQKVVLSVDAGSKQTSAVAFG